MKFDPWVGNIPWRRAWQPTPVFLPGNPVDRGAQRATVHGAAKSWTRLETQHACMDSINEFTITLFNIFYQYVF